MDFITRALGKFLYFLGILTSSFFSKAYGNVEQATYIKYVEEIYNNFIKEMKKCGFHCILDKGGMPHDVRQMGLGFEIYQKGSIEEGREKIVFLSEKFLETINSHEAIRPYLREYPFPESRISLSLRFKKSNGQYYENGSISRVYHTRSKIFYATEDPITKHDIDALVESYNEGMAKLNRNAPAKRTAERTIVEDRVVPSKKRLGTLNTNLAGFTPERGPEALGIKNVVGQKEFADELGELIGGICDEYFGEEFLERLAQTVSKNQAGEYIEYWDNGQIKTRIPYKDGTAEGHIHGWYLNGESAFKGYYKDGKRVGIQLAGYPIRGIDPIGRLLEYDMEGKLHREQLTFDIDLDLLAIIHYNHGVLHGNASFYEAKHAGACYGEWEYKNGKIKKIKIPPSTTGIKY